MGSVKELEIATEPTADSNGNGFFNFKDTYSVFDWGAMPDLIKDKGKALALMGAKTFIEAYETGVPTIYSGMFGPRQMIKYDLKNVPIQRIQRIKELINCSLSTLSRIVHCILLDEE